MFCEGFANALRMIYEGFANALRMFCNRSANAFPMLCARFAKALPNKTVMNDFQESLSQEIMNNSRKELNKKESILIFFQ